MVFGVDLSYVEIVKSLDVNYIAGSTNGYKIQRVKYEASDINFIIKSLLPVDMKVDNTIDDIVLKSSLTVNRSISFTRKSFFYTILGSIESHSGVLGDIESLIVLIPGSYKSDEPINITGIDKIHLKCYCIEGSIVKGVRETSLCSFALDKTPGHIMNTETRIKNFIQIKESVLSFKIFVLEDDDHKLVDFKGEKVGFTCQLIKLK